MKKKNQILFLTLLLSAINSVQAAGIQHCPFVNDIKKNYDAYLVTSDGWRSQIPWAGKDAKYKVIGFSKAETHSNFRTVRPLLRSCVYHLKFEGFIYELHMVPNTKYIINVNDPSWIRNSDDEYICIAESPVACQFR